MNKTHSVMLSDSLEKIGELRVKSEELSLSG